MDHEFSIFCQVCKLRKCRKRYLVQARVRGGSRSIDWRGPYGERGARAYNGGLGAMPPAGSRGRVPGQGVSPPEAERLLVLSYV